MFEFRLRHKVMLGGAVALLFAGSASSTMAQEVPDLRLDTTTGLDDDVVPLPPPPAIAKVPEAPPVAPRRKVAAGDAFEPAGLDLGGFRLYPTLELGTAATSNVASSPTNRKADVGLRVKPGLRLESDWSRHQFTASGSAELLEYLDNSKLSTSNGSAQAALRLDVRHTTHADFDASYTLASTGAENSEVPDTAVGDRRDQTIGASAAITHDLGGVELRLRGGAVRNVYGDVKLSGGGTEDNKDRNYTELSASARAALKTGAVFEPFVEAAYEPRFHDRRVDRNGTRRNSQGLRLAAGVTLSDDPLWTGELAGNLNYRNYADSGLDSVLAPGMTASLTWRPTDLTRFEFNAGASIAETVTAGSSATRTWTAGATVVHGLRENLDLIAGLTGTLDDTASGNNLTTDARLGLEWKLNPGFSWTAFYQGTWFDGAASGSNHQEHQLLTSIILKR